MKRPGCLTTRMPLSGKKLADWAGLDSSRAQDLSRCRPPRSAMRSDISPETLARVLEGQARLERSGRQPAAVPPASPGRGKRDGPAATGARQCRQRAKTRVNRMMTYAEGRRCRHAELAAHLGERLDPCGDACDVCTSERAEGI